MVGSVRLGGVSGAGEEPSDREILLLMACSFSYSSGIAGDLIMTGDESHMTIGDEVEDEDESVR